MSNIQLTYEKDSNPMKCSFQISPIANTKADVMVFFIAEDADVFEKQQSLVLRHAGADAERYISAEEFKGKDSDMLALLPKDMGAKRLLLVGLGEQKNLTSEKMRRAAAKAARKAQAYKATSVAMLLPDLQVGFTLEEAVKGIIEASILSLYKFDKYHTESKEKKTKVESVFLFSEIKDHEKEIKKAIAEAMITAEAVCLARDLSNAPPNEIYPETMAQTAKRSAKRSGFRCTVWDKKKIESEKFGGLLAVSSGSAKPPRFLIMEHNAEKKKLPLIVLVGKGVTFDAGGISIKPAAGMAEMKMDMSGAAAVIGTMQAVAQLKLPVRVTGLVPATENLLGSAAMRPGDIITHYGGKTSEVDNTDAEGRLILADALAYATTLKPTAVIDLATLTGACVVALGHYATGMMGNNEELMATLKTAGETTYERVWQLPMYDEYEKLIKSDVADVKNVGGRWAGAITAAFFLKKFIGDYKWVHLDIAGTAMLEEEMPYAQRGGSGVGVRLLVEMLRNWK